MARQRAGRFEIGSWVVGLSLLAFVAAALVHRWLGHDDAIDAFREAQRQFRAAPHTFVSRAVDSPAAVAQVGGAKAMDGAFGGAPGRETSGLRPPALSARAGIDSSAALPLLRVASAASPDAAVPASTTPAAAATAPPRANAVLLDGNAPVDTSLWSEARVRGYEESLKATLAAPSALLHIPAIDLTVPVLEGIDEVSLNRGVGRIPGTAPVGGPGNLGIAGHRDGYFRRLKDIGPGTRLELETLAGRRSYTVSDIWIVKPADVHVLEPTESPSITLVTCYPFYFVGHAPERYIVRATIDGASAASP